MSVFGDRYQVRFLIFGSSDKPEVFVIQKNR